MDYSKEIAFAREHSSDDPIKLVLQQSSHPELEMRIVAQQIEGQRQASVKWPRLSRCENFLFPPKLNREQSSSEQTSNYKTKEILSKFASQKALSIADLTGGMGIDSIAFASNPDIRTSVEYFEINRELHEIMCHNVEVLHLNNIHCHCENSIEWLQQKNTRFDIIFIDPARRDCNGKKVYAFEDCTPNILDNLGLFSNLCDTFIVKASPMIHIPTAIEQLGNVKDVHIVSVKGECKEILFVCQGGNSKTKFHCANITVEKTFQEVYDAEEESSAKVSYCQHVGKYLYEPNASIMKGGCFNIISERYSLSLLGRNTHLYTGNTLLETFPGRRFLVLQEIALNKKSVISAIPAKKAHVVTRNYPVDANKLQKQIGINEGGELFIIATTIGEKKAGFLCQQL